MNSFSPEQSAHETLREIWKMRTRQIVPWIGAGLSADAGMPTWAQLRERILEILKSEAVADLSEAERVTIASQQDLWVAFEILILKIGRPVFQSLVNQIFESAAKCKIPDNYKKLWRLRPRGIVSLNIDPLAQRAGNSALGEEYISLISNRNLGSHGAIFQSDKKFLVNLHGTLDEGEKWVFTKTDLRGLQQSGAYKHFIGSLFAANVVVFIGVGADDEGVIAHLRYLSESGIDMGTHYWVTDRDDGKAIGICRELGIRIIHYPKKTHTESISDFLSDIDDFIPSEVVPAPIVPNIGRKRHVDSPDPATLLSRPSNEVRQILNQLAVNILQSGAPERAAEYSKFKEQYEEAIHRSWYVRGRLPDSYFGYSLIRKISADGAFGQVYQAKNVDSSDGAEYAIKLIHDRIRDEDDMLSAFRRGVDSMRILTKSGVDGVVKIIDAWELPASLVMEFVPGSNLQEAVETHQIVGFSQVLSIGRQLTQVVLSAHRLPERVLHRDIRPANIILEDFYDKDDQIRVKVLDFDLSWHKDAVGMSLELRSAPNGYVAPEQIDPARRRLTRNALVDSFGIGMTLFFVCSGVHPVPGVHMGSDWTGIVERGLGRMGVSSWKSVPRRLARLLLRATKDRQNERPLLDHLLLELMNLERLNAGDVKLAETSYIAEEICCRMPSLADRWIWSSGEDSGVIESPSGVRLEVVGGEFATIGFRFSWEHDGARGYSDIRKYIGPKTEKAVSLIRSAGGRVADKNISFDRCRVVADFPLMEKSLMQNIDDISGAIERIFDALKFN